jgi:P27 family predicted phage terminase small subunit
LRKVSENIKKLSGTARVPPKKLAISAGCVSPCPDAGLHPIAKAEWRRVVAAMKKHGLITDLDAAVLGAYCANFARMKLAEAHVLSEGAVIEQTVTDSHGRAFTKLVKSPYLTVANESARLLKQLAETLGLSPVSRGRMGIETEPGDGGDDEGYDLLAALEEEHAAKR